MAAVHREPESQREAPKIRKWRGFKIKHFLKPAFLTKFIFPEARVGDPTKPHFQELNLAADTERHREAERRARAAHPTGAF